MLLTYYQPLATYHSSLTTHHLPLTSYHSPLTTQTAFLEACQGGHASVAQVFLDRGIDTELRTNNQCVDRVEKSPADTSLRGPPSPARPECCILRSACCGIVSSVSLTHILYSAPPGGPLSSSQRSAAASSCSSCCWTVAPRSMPPTAASGVRHSRANPAHYTTLAACLMCA